MHKFTHFIFDLDGTLLHTLPELLYNMNLAFKKLNLPGDFSEAEMATFIGSGKDEQIRRAMRARSVPESKFRAINDVLSVYYAQNTSERTFPFPGVNDVISALKSANTPIYIATNKPEDIAVDVVKSFFADDTFLEIRGDRGDGIVKPDPNFLGTLIKDLNTAPENVLFIGDSKVDFMTAKNAGVTCAIVPYGYDKNVFSLVDDDLIFLEAFTDILKFRQ